MSNNVFANGREVSCKKADGKTICNFPDVCFTPPENPATPPGVPVPYPNTAFAKDTTSGSKTVKISGQEVMLKNKSYFKKSAGNEAGSAPKKGAVTSTNRGKVYFNSWSMDVKFEGENVVRHLDLTTHNHASQTGQTPPWTYIDSVAVPPLDHPCKEEIENAQEACKDSTKVQVGSRMHRICDEEGKCEKAMGCILVPKGKDKEMCCSPDNTGHHLIEDHWIRPGGELVNDFASLGEKGDSGRYKKPGGPYNGAPTMCANKSRYHGKHGIAHGTGGVMEEKFIGKDFKYADGKKIALAAHKDAYPDGGCTEQCIESQLDDFYNDDGKKKFHSPNRKQPMKPEQREAAIRRVFGEGTM